jgi:cytochrome b6-f complex iron-sulfur subunit
MERREFLKSTAAFCTVISLGSLAGCTTYRAVSSEFENGKLKIKKLDFLQDNWVVVKSERTNAPILLSKNTKEEYSAVLMLCTHKQCEVKPTGTVLTCQCHGSEFSFAGKVLSEPADKDLVLYETSTDENYIYITI